MNAIVPVLMSLISSAIDLYQQSKAKTDEEIQRIAASLQAALDLLDHARSDAHADVQSRDAALQAIFDAFKQRAAAVGSALAGKVT